ncbi:Ig-like domain-containing alpha-2-macroglobulin family protein [Caballeronia sp. M1242]|uniref:Ig-like domain-containing alpha-2-macroglobulin family protein n=1 Tax=Caballeronia sp. M1242 TaxID=2814653 RepID=UPI0019D0BB83|nr:Ig-like domain-containing alpha-2-macroglobulin family protein [Caballeronia sp. M1242]QSN60213.1 Ig-like domain-containing protein [Caballeronia sp. M1242]
MSRVTNTQKWILAATTVLAALGLSAAVHRADAARAASVSPQGKVTQARQVVVKFDEPMTAFGNPAAAAPGKIACSGAPASATAGSARWIDQKTWAFDFAADLPPGVRCSIDLDAGLKSAAGNALAGPSHFTFETGGPFVTAIQPDYGDIEEDQAFVLRLNGPATQASVLDHVWCESSAIGNRIPVRMLDSATRGAILKQFHYEKESDRVLTLACQQTLPSATKMQLVYGVGVTGPSGIPNDAERRFEFKVREPFKAGFTCERENAQAPCTPLRPLRVTFTAPISRTDAQKFVLRGPKGTAAPHFDPDNKDDEVSGVEFAAPLPERASLTIEAPADLKDVSGRKLANADFFPLKTQTAPMPPLAKFSSGEFGIIERFAEPNMPAMLPVTLRHVEADLHVQGLNSGTSKITSLRVDADTDIRQWMKTVEAFGGMSINRRTVESLAPHALTNGIAPIVTNTTDGVYFDARSLSLLSKHAGVETLTLPAADPKALRPFEVVGIPLSKPGFYVVELASPALGASLMAKHQAMYVRTSVLVTNLGVHLKQGRENSLVWVTTLDKGKPVPNAQVRVTDCNGEQVAAGVTDGEGIARIGKSLAPLHECNGTSLAYGGFFVSARVSDPATGPDMAFVMSDWNRGIESWRFNVPTDMSSTRTTRAHTVFDRTLLRAGETVSMKHLMRVETLGGLAFPKRYPTRVTIRHVGSGQTWHLPLTWAADHSADSTFTVPTAAKLGEYSVSLDDGTAQGTSDDDDARVTESYETGSFRVEEFRLPVFKGSISAGDSKSAGLIAAREAPVSVRLEYVQGGAASKVPVAVSALVKDIAPPFASQYDAFSFAPYRKPANDGASAPAEDQNDDDEAQQQQSDATTKLVADKERVTLDRDGVGKLTVAPLPAVDAPKRLALEATFADPNGEVQTISGNTTLWPAAVAVGVKSGSWVSVGSTVPVQAIALDLQGKPRAGVPMQIKGIVHAMTSSRKRMVGGFYAYDNHTETNDLGTLCSGKSDDHGLLSCEAKLKQPGNIDLIAVAKDGDGREANATTSVWVTREDELWFGGENTDRIDVLPEKTSYEPGETARFQVRMPFRSATALVAVEREGIVETHVAELNGKDPTIDLKVQDAWGPNVYVSVLALRGRLRDVPWYSFFTWGWKAPVEWARAFWYEGRQYQAPTPLVDLSKPAFRYGLASIKVGIASHKLAVSVSPDAKSYSVRGKAHVKVKVALPDGKPAPAGTQIAVAAVDEALLELMPNQSWNVLDAMLQQRAYGVETSTAQMEIIGRRHFGRKAVPAGGGGGHSPTRELFDTLLLWNPRVTLDANGEATLDVPLNDSLTRFRIVAIAAVGAGRFGTGSASIQTGQDLQLVSGLPPLVRVGDTFRAQFTLRNTTPRAMRVLVTPRAGSLALDSRTVALAAESSQEVAWDVTPPDMPGGESSASLAWNVSAVEQGTGKASDAVKLTQRIVAAIPVSVQQATIAQVDGTLSVPVAPPADATKTAAGTVRGGIAVSLQPKLADGLPGVRRWFLNYPYSCLEQQTSRALGLMDAAQWQAVLAHMATYLDADGLANYFPPYDDSRATGSPTLTAYLLAVTDEAAKTDRRFALPADLRDRLTAALANVVDGKIQRNFWAPRNGFDFEKLAAIEALSRYGVAQPRMLDSITIAPNQWPTSAVLDYYAILSRVDGIPDREVKRAQAEQIIRARLTYQGTRLTFSTASDDDLWWFMTGVETNAARTALLFADAPGWKDEMPRLVAGLLALQTNGAWSTTTANLWGSLAVARFSRVFESTPVTGSTDIRLGASSKTVDWAAAAPAPMASATPITRTANTRSVMLPWSTGSLALTQQGTGKPWATIESLAAVDMKAPLAAGYRIAKTITPVEPAVKGAFSRGDIVRVSLDIDAQSDMTWVVVNDPIPAGATILGSGLGRDSESATQGERSSGQWPMYVERAFDGYRAYYDYLPKGKLHVEYTMRLNNAGSFGLPPTRVEALYAPSTFGALPNARMVVNPLAAR